MKLTLAMAQKLMDDDGNLDLSGISITSLPDNLTVGGSLDLSGSSITSLPDNLTVGGWLDLSGSSIKKRNVKHLANGDYAPGRYLYADGILTLVQKSKTMNGITYFKGKIPGRNVVYDGKNYAHCADFREGIADLNFKYAKDRGASQYKTLSLDTEFPINELMTMYRIITGACKQGTQSFVDSFGKNRKERYTIREVIELTEGQYGANRFKEFFSD